MSYCVYLKEKDFLPFFYRLKWYRWYNRSSVIVRDITRGETIKNEKSARNPKGRRALFLVITLIINKYIQAPQQSFLHKKSRICDFIFYMAGGLGFEPRKCQIQSLVPYRLAIPQFRQHRYSNKKPCICQQQISLF